MIVGENSRGIAKNCIPYTNQDCKEKIKESMDAFEVHVNEILHYIIWAYDVLDITLVAIVVVC